MADSTKEQTLLVVDSGLFTHVAEGLSPFFARTMYWTEWVRSPFPEEKHTRIGDLPGIERVNDVYAAIDGADYVVFPDVVTANLASYVKKLGKPYFGTTKHAAELELDRWEFRKLTKEAGLPIREMTRVVGVDDLRAVLEHEKDVYVKYGHYRGDLETFHHDVWFTTREWYADLVKHLGPSGDSVEFLIQQPIDGIEIGVDGTFMDGKWCDTVMYGYELKDSGYVGQMIAYDELPTPLRVTADGMGKMLREREHRGWVSTEVRIGKDRIPYLTDPCLRCGSPPSESQALAYENMGDVVRGKAPVSKGKYVAQLILKSVFAEKNFLAFDIPEKYRENIKLHNHAVIGGKDYTVPINVDGVGAACGYGDKIFDAIDMAMEAAEAVKAYDLDYNKAAFEELEKTIEDGMDVGVDW